MVYTFLFSEGRMGVSGKFARRSWSSCRCSSSLSFSCGDMSSMAFLTGSLLSLAVEDGTLPCIVPFDCCFSCSSSRFRYCSDCGQGISSFRIALRSSPLRPLSSL